MAKDYEKVREEIGKSAEGLIQRPAEKYKKILDFYIIKEPTVKEGYSRLCENIANQIDEEIVEDYEDEDDEMEMDEANFIAEQKLKILKREQDEESKR